MALCLSASSSIAFHWVLQYVCLCPRHNGRSWRCLVSHLPPLSRALQPTSHSYALNFVHALECAGRYQVQLQLPQLGKTTPHKPPCTRTHTLSSQEAFTELVAHLTRNPDAKLPLATRKGNVTAAQVVALLEPVGGATLPNPTACLVLTVEAHTNHRWPRTCMYLHVPRVFPSTSLMPQLPLAAPAVVARMWTALLLRVARCHLTASGTQRHPLVPSSRQQMATPQLMLLRKLPRARRSKHSPRFGSHTNAHTPYVACMC